MMGGRGHRPQALIWTHRPLIWLWSSAYLVTVTVPRHTELTLLPTRQAGSKDSKT